MPGKDESVLRCSVTVMPILGASVGFVRREEGDTFAGKLVAPGGKIEMNDGKLLDGVRYWSAEMAAVRELIEETGILVSENELEFLCSLTLPNGVVVVSLYCRVDKNVLAHGTWAVEFYTRTEIESRNDFAPGMKQEALWLLDKLGIK